MSDLPLPRTLKAGSTRPGPDVDGIGRALVKAGFLLAGVPGAIRVYQGMPRLWRETYGSRKAAAVNAFRKAEGMPQTGTYGPKLHQLLLDGGYFDAKAVERVMAYRPPDVIVSPVTVGAVPTYLHPTAGLLGNWALDWMTPGGTPVRSPEGATVKKLSGRHPSEGANHVVGIFGWSLHLETKAGYRYFLTHLGEREPLMAGQWVQAGERLGKVGHWPGNPPRSHLHMGVTSPLGVADAKKRIQAVAKARR